MILKNLIYKTNPKIIHCPQCEPDDPLLKIFISKLKKRLFDPLNSNLDIISWDNNAKNNILKHSANLLDYKIKFLGQNSIWDNNRIKIKLTNDFLKSTKKKYIMGIDSYDALIVGDLNDLIANFELMKPHKLIFNATVTSYPPVSLLTDFEKNKFKGPWTHLNAGAWIGEVDYCRYFFNNLMPKLKKAQELYPVNDGLMGEQILVRLMLMEEYPLTSIDWKCELFQIVREPNVYPKELQSNRGIEVNNKTFKQFMV